MKAADVSAVAHHLFEERGPAAIAEAAHKAMVFDEDGDEQQAKFWHRVEAVLREMSGPRQT